ncbi:MAG: DUF362 domain-containing protein [Promethearchaeota archaeon]
MGKKLKKKDLKPIERNTPSFQKLKKVAWVTRLPIIKQLYRKKTIPDGFDSQAGQYIPINLKMGDYESETVPLKVIDHFIDKAGTIVIIQCPCRVSNDCKNYSKDLGCIWMGKGAAHLDLENLPLGVKGRYATKEEAKQHARAAIKEGLIPALGKFRGDAKAFGVLEYENEFMDFCFCCSCCCITAGMKYGNSDWRKFVKKMKGVKVIVDPNKCIGCGECFKVCIYNGRKMVKGKAVVDQEKCIACGRCAKVCPNGATSVIFDENLDINDAINEIIERYEKIVDISG